MTIRNRNGTADVEIYPDGSNIALVYRTVNDEAIVVRGPEMSKVFAALAVEVGGFELEWQYPEELNLPTMASEQIGTSVERYDEPFYPDEEFDSDANNDLEGYK